MNDITIILILCTFLVFCGLIFWFIYLDNKLKKDIDKHFDNLNDVFSQMEKDVNEIAVKMHEITIAILTKKLNEAIESGDKEKELYFIGELEKLKK